MRAVLACLIAIFSASVAVAASPPNYDDATLRAVQFVDKYEGWVVGDSGAIWHTIDGGKAWERQPSGTRASLRAVKFLSPYTGWIVGRTELPNGAGSSGVVLFTADGGASWKEINATSLPGLNSVDFQDENRGRATANATATFLHTAYTTADGGRTWTPGSDGKATSQTAQMIDATTGWVVGNLGTIRATTDGGKTWTLQKAGGQKVAILFVHDRPEAVPFGAIAAIGGRDGYLAAAMCPEQCEEPRLTAAVRSSGGAMASVGDFGVDQFVLALRTLRPEVVVADASNSAIIEAVKQAADAKSFPDQIDKLGLTSHEVKKVYAVTSSPEGAIALDLTTFSPELLDSPKDFAEPAAMLFGAKNPEKLHFKLIASRIPGADAHKSLMEGIVLAEGGTARRKKPETVPPATVIATRESASKLRRQLDAFAATGDPEKSVPEIVAGIAKLPAESAARTANALAQTLAERGQWSAAREVYAFTAEHMPTHPEAVDAIRWLIRYHASSEVRRRIELGHGPIFQKSAFAASKPEGVQQAAHTQLGSVEQKVKFASADVLRQWHQIGLDLEPKLATFGGAYTREPGTNLALVADRKNLGRYADATRQLQVLVPNEAEAGNDWQGRMADEIQLLTSKNAVPKTTPIAECRFTTERPTLDGKLDEAFWAKCPPLPVAKDKLVGDYGTETRFAFDDKFLYVGVKCTHPEGKAVPKVEKRERDAEMQDRDRVEIFLDLDRDYQTYYRLRVDHRGCVAEDCWGDATWNPNWYVGFDSGPTGWTAEMAIPLAELTGLNPANGHVWAMNVVRVVPGVKTDSWGSPAAVEPKPSGMGLMKFVK